MDKQLAKINEFVQSIDNKVLTRGQNSFILASPVNVIGGSNGSGNCNNYQAEACGGTNKRCTNYGVCGTSDNTRNCTNKPVDPDPIDMSKPG